MPLKAAFFIVKDKTSAVGIEKNTYGEDLSMYLSANAASFCPTRMR
jgi:hypothetical protein